MLEFEGSEERMCKEYAKHLKMSSKNRIKVAKELDIQHLIDMSLILKSNYPDIIMFQLLQEAVDFLKKDFGKRSNKKHLDEHYKINYVVDCGNQFFLNEYFKFYVLGELRSKEYKACVIDLPKYKNVAMIVKR